MRVRYVGSRVTVRTRIPSAPGEPSATDTVGVLRRWRDGMLEIELRDGSVRTLAEADLLAAKIVAPGGTRGAPARRQGPL